MVDEYGAHAGCHRRGKASFLKRWFGPYKRICVELASVLAVPLPKDPGARLALVRSADGRAGSAKGAGPPRKPGFSPRCRAIGAARRLPSVN